KQEPELEHALHQNVCSMLKEKCQRSSVLERNKRLCTVEATSSQCDFAFISHAIGGGIRYRTPIGPVRLDIGYNLNPPTYPFFQVQPDNTEVFRSKTLDRWHFSFSIGQTF